MDNIMSYTIMFYNDNGYVKYTVERVIELDLESTYFYLSCTTKRYKYILNRNNNILSQYERDGNIAIRQVFDIISYRIIKNGCVYV